MQEQDSNLKLTIVRNNWIHVSLYLYKCTIKYTTYEATLRMNLSLYKCNKIHCKWTSIESAEILILTHNKLINLSPAGVNYSYTRRPYSNWMITSPTNQANILAAN